MGCFVRPACAGAEDRVWISGASSSVPEAVAAEIVTVEGKRVVHVLV